ncbi:response regulator transcription factor [Desulfopila aestuarii]|uniref:DNA-binding response regulator, OmpR family, contains REC and winged-helix (WHTH) domain n=1 Tax=Desulfopila aestuarii DSM 18488 TaxID=1121416 RepID=A0A1M7YKZ0_9BACT|nr:response regulator transcription factor [Desulfopila aestuarii]SHO53258.1 DNA-binding response regulator, OmpR family, contains REC and winged-helix (wHTH) domain [Desulfopila aestuarii DSM 18488]
MNILVIEDEPDLLERLTSILTREHYTVVTASDGKEGLEKIWDDRYDLILLDIMLPHVNGLEVLAELRAAGIQTPVLMLTAKGDISDKVIGLNLGADDYLAKPFSLAEFLARVRALLRRSTSASPIIEAGHIQLNTNTREVLSDGKVLPLTAKEFGILEFLLHNKDRAVSKFTLAEHVWGDEFDPFSMSNFIDVHIKNLRKKISAGGKPALIVTVRGFGYRLEN